MKGNIKYPSNCNSNLKQGILKRPVKIETIIVSPYAERRWSRGSDLGYMDEQCGVALCPCGGNDVRRNCGTSSPSFINVINIHFTVKC